MAKPDKPKLRKEVIEQSPHIMEAVQFESIPFYTGKLGYAVLATDKDSSFKINFRFEKLAPKLLKEIVLFFRTRVLDFLYKTDDPDVEVSAGRTQFTDHTQTYINNWDVVIHPFPKWRAKIVLETVISMMKQQFKNGF